MRCSNRPRNGRADETSERPAGDRTATERRPGAGVGANDRAFAVASAVQRPTSDRRATDAGYRARMRLGSWNSAEPPPARSVAPRRETRAGTGWAVSGRQVAGKWCPVGWGTWTRPPSRCTTRAAATATDRRGAGFDRHGTVMLAALAAAGEGLTCDGGVTVVATTSRPKLLPIDCDTGVTAAVTVASYRGPYATLTRTRDRGPARSPCTRERREGRRALLAGEPVPLLLREPAGCAATGQGARTGGLDRPPDRTASLPARAVVPTGRDVPAGSRRGAAGVPPRRSAVFGPPGPPAGDEEREGMMTSPRHFPPRLAPARAFPRCRRGGRSRCGRAPRLAPLLTGLVSLAVFRTLAPTRQEVSAWS
jgi:hypothetical protein